MSTKPVCQHASNFKKVECFGYVSFTRLGAKKSYVCWWGCWCQMHWTQSSTRLGIKRAGVLHEEGQYMLEWLSRCHKVAVKLDLRLAEYMCLIFQMKKLSWFCNWIMALMSEILRVLALTNLHTDIYIKYKQHL